MRFSEIENSTVRFGALVDLIFFLASVEVNMAPGCNQVPFRSDERDIDSSCNYCRFAFSSACNQGFSWASGHNLILHLVGGSRGPNEIISGWDQIWVGSGAGGITFGVFLWEGFSENSQVYQAEKSIVLESLWTCFGAKYCSCIRNTRQRDVRNKPSVNHVT